eukprot:CAMPEP_0174312608 /NCGR_PEP_ID=MMETSP0810-20121108/4397_1 /TAXON_ID=73025 ORGANISM="Eutreptiella gymnastica-like, Strain CCMP1594" /NCGR_SAMPLE_ID=MMETSP0810 /ASSEMBLY_ACC=CAM_ASM_000659 /LENGTH=422 /DNA_ID=CAMNT_0015421045 /DNA_START=12 /DNA_END=1280 /DNA_ORIENTATION=+
MTSGWKERGAQLVGIKVVRDYRPTAKAVSTPTFAQGLADPDDNDERDRALNALGPYLASKNMDYSEANTRALWRGLWMCLWFSDKPLVQLDCYTRISKLVENVPRTADRSGISKPILWQSSFWLQIIEEWPKLDFHRIDKHLALMRLMLFESFKVLKEPTTTHRDLVFFERTIVEVLEKSTAGVSLQLCNCWLSEAKNAKLPKHLLTLSLRPFIRWMATAPVMHYGLWNKLFQVLFCDKLFKLSMFDPEMFTEVLESEKTAAIAQLKTKKRGPRDNEWYKRLLAKAKKNKVVKAAVKAGERQKVRQVKEKEGNRKRQRDEEADDNNDFDDIDDRPVAKLKKKKQKTIFLGDALDFGYCQKYGLTERKSKNKKTKKKQISTRELQGRERREEIKKQHPKQFANRTKLKFSDFKDMDLDAQGDD